MKKNLLFHHGVKVYILLYSNVAEKMQLELGNDRVAAKLNLFKNIQVMFHGAGLDDLFLWSHHEKLCIVDQCVAFVGGIDLCTNRWDDDRYLLLDDKVENLTAAVDAEGNPQFPGEFETQEGMIHGAEGQLWQGKDYSNTFKALGGGFDDWHSDNPDLPRSRLANIISNR